MRKKLYIFLIPVIVLLICCLTALLFIDSKPASGNELYLEYIQMADEFYTDNDFDNAIIYYKKAIECDNTQDTPYISLANIYYSTNRADLAVDILKQGLPVVLNSNALQELLQRYEKTNATEPKGLSVAPKNNTSQEIINDELIREFSDWDYERYGRDYTVENESFENGVYTVRYIGLNAKFRYYNQENIEGVVDEESGKPAPQARPTEIILDDVNDLLRGAENGITLEQFTERGVFDVKVTTDTGNNIYTLSFKYLTCEILVECDENGNVTGNGIYNVIFPTQRLLAENKVTVSGRIINVSDANLVSGALIEIRSGFDNIIGEIIQETTAEDGSYTVELDKGEYTFEISAEGYNTEYFNVRADETVSVMLDFSITPKLKNGQIRIVLEWGETPLDLDSHLNGETSKGTAISVDFTSPTANEGDDEIAVLDVDDTNGYGPETITINDVGGSYSYRVHRFSNSGSLKNSGAVVKVYMSDSSQPVTFEVPSDVDDEWWDVFTIINGELIAAE